jgi:hypothetical protein
MAVQKFSLLGQSTKLFYTYGTEKLFVPVSQYVQPPSI